MNDAPPQALLKGKKITTRLGVAAGEIAKKIETFGAGYHGYIDAKMYKRRRDQPPRVPLYELCRAADAVAHMGFIVGKSIAIGALLSGVILAGTGAISTGSAQGALHALESVKSEPRSLVLFPLLTSIAWSLEILHPRYLFDNSVHQTAEWVLKKLDPENRHSYTTRAFPVSRLCALPFRRIEQALESPEKRKKRLEHEEWLFRAGI